MTMSKTMSDEQRTEFLKGLGLKPDAPGLADMPARVVEPKKAQQSDEIVVAPPGVDPRAMPIDDIVLDPRLLDDYDDLAFDKEGNEASRKIFALYKSYTKNKERNGALQRKITSFITAERRNRETGGMVKEKIKASKEDRDLAALIASQGVSAKQLAKALAKLAEEED